MKLTRTVFVPNVLAGRKLTAPSDTFRDQLGRFTRQESKRDAQGREVVRYYQRSYVIERATNSDVWLAVLVWSAA